jgi:collagen type VII alpha
MHWAGAWSPTAPPYNTQDYVSYNGGSYVSIQGGNLNNPPSTSPSWWTQTAATGGPGATGATGASITGPTGATGTGTPGATGATGASITGPTGATGTGAVGAVTVVGAGALTSGACMTGGGTTTAQTPSVNCSVDSSGNVTTNSLNVNGPSTGTIGIKGITSGNSVSLSVSPTTGVGSLGLPAATGTVAYTASLGTSGHCKQYAADGIGDVDTGSACGTSSAAPGLTLIEEHTASASAELDFTTCITATYDDYLIKGVSLIPGTNASNLLLQVSTNGGSTYVATGSYNWGYTYLAGGSGGPGTVNAAADTAIHLGNAFGTTTSQSASFSIGLSSPAAGIFPQFLTDTTNINSGGGSFNYYRYSGLGEFALTTSINAFRILFSSGNIASGTVRCYGLAK